MQRARQKRTMADMRALALAWDSRATEAGRYAAAGMTMLAVPVTMEQMETLLTPTYVREMVRVDGWKNELEFAVDTPATSYMIRSYGRDGVPQSPPAGGATTQFDCDIIYSNGQFIQYPDGVQVQ
jgi:hypothetical protein